MNELRDLIKLDVVDNDWQAITRACWAEIARQTSYWLTHPEKVSNDLIRLAVSKFFSLDNSCLRKTQRDSALIEVIQETGTKIQRCTPSRTFLYPRTAL